MCNVFMTLWARGRGGTTRPRRRSNVMGVPATGR